MVFKSSIQQPDGGPTTIPVPIAQGGTNATSFTTNTVIGFDGTRMISIPGSVLGTGLSVGSVDLARLSVGSNTPLSGLSDTYFFCDGGMIVREHGLASGQCLNLGSATTSGTYSIGNLSGQGTGGFLRFDTNNTTLTGGNGDVNILTNNGAQILLSGSDASVFITNQIFGNFLIVDSGGGVTLRAFNDSGGIYADGTNTYVGDYAAGSAIVVDSVGNETVPGNGYFAGMAIAIGVDLIGGDIGLQDAINGQEIIGTFDSGATYQIGGDNGSNGLVKFQSPAYYSQPAVLIGVGATDTGFGSLQVPGTAYFGSNTGVGGLGNSSTWLNLAAGNTNTTPLRFNSALLVSSLQNGAFEWNGTHFYATTGSVRYRLDQVVASGTAAAMTSGVSSNTVSGVLSTDLVMVNLITPGGVLGARSKASCGSNNVTITSIGTTGLTVTSETSTYQYTVFRP